MPGIPRAVFRLTAGANATGNVTALAFKKSLATLLRVFETSLLVTVDYNSGPSATTGEYDIIVEFVGPRNSLAEEFQRALELTPSELATLGAASISSAAPVTTTAKPEEEEEFPLVIVAVGAGAGLFVLIVGLIIYRKTKTAEEDQQRQKDSIQQSARRSGSPAVGDGYAPEIMVAGDGYFHPNNNSPRDGSTYADQPMLQVPSLRTHNTQQQQPRMTMMRSGGGGGRIPDPDL